MLTHEQVTACTNFRLAARFELGVAELAGPANSARVLEYLATCGKSSIFRLESTPSCSAFVNFIVLNRGVSGTRKANARSWLTWGEPTDKPIPGCVVVFSRPPAPWSGHVALFERVDPDGSIVVLGGNQKQRVSVARYPARRLLGYRVPTVAMLPVENVA